MTEAYPPAVGPQPANPQGVVLDDLSKVLKACGEAIKDNNSSGISAASIALACEHISTVLNVIVTRFDLNPAEVTTKPLTQFISHLLASSPAPKEKKASDKLLPL